MRLATVEQSQKIDKISQEEYHLSGEVLMESAGALASREIAQSFYPEISKGSIAVVCGPGNNGGDGLVVARHLHSAGYRDLSVFCLEKNKGSELFQKQYDRAELQGLKLIDLGKEDDVRSEALRSCELIIDAVFGIGLQREVQGVFKKVIEVINSSKAKRVSLDIPSGLDGNRGVVQGVCVKSTMTLSFGLAKPGLYVGEGPEYCGRLRVLPIGFPYEALRSVATDHFLFNEKLAQRYLKKRKDTTNKSDHGHLLVGAGRKGFWGAGILASHAAYRMGVGYVTWASFEEPLEDLKQIPEVLVSHLRDSKYKKINETKFTAWALGPGLGVTEELAELIDRLKQQKASNVILDADAIRTCQSYNLFPLPSSWVLTPHSGELSPIIQTEAREIDRNKFASALEGARICGCHVLLKGFRSILAYEKRSMIINSGNAALAKAGSGDILTGMIGALIAQGFEPLQATATAAYIHGRMADEWIRMGNDKNTLMASDLKDHLPSLLGRISEGTLV